MLKYKFNFVKSFYDLDSLFRLRCFKNEYFYFKHNIWGFRLLESDILFVKKLNRRLLGLPLYFFPSQSNTLSTLNSKYVKYQGREQFFLPFSFFFSKGHKKKAQNLFYLYFYKNVRFYIKNASTEITDLASLVSHQKLHFFLRHKIFVFSELQKYIRNAQVRRTKFLFFDAFSLPYYVEVIFTFENNCFSLLFSSFFFKY